jgi:hypothetical protein
VSVRCSDASRALGESQIATAVTAQCWLLLEVAAAWPRDVAVEGALPDEAQKAVAAWLERTPGSRLQFVRRPGRAAARPLAFVVRGEEARREIRRIELGRHDDLASIDLDHEGDVVEGSLVLVCGHGSRDQCCALRGTAVFGELVDSFREDELWISSHQGGHRFAANVLLLPAGVQLGRVDAGEAASLVARALDGTIALDRYRGRTCYDPTVQAAEYAVRAAAGLDRVDDLRLVGVEDGLVRFRGAGGPEWTAVVEEGVGPAVPASCGAEAAPQPSRSARLL